MNREHTSTVSGARSLCAIPPSTSPTQEPPLSLRLLPNLPTERDRIAAAQRGDEAARQWLLEQYTPVVYRFCIRMMGNEQDARDITQDVFVKVLRHLPKYDRRWAFKTWVFTIARNTCLDEFRRRKRRGEVAETEVVATGPSPLDEVDRKMTADQLTAALQDISPMYREVIVLHHLENRKFAEISQMLDIPMGTVMNRIFRARQRLRNAYEARQSAQMRERRYAWAAGRQ